MFTLTYYLILLQSVSRGHLGCHHHCQHRLSPEPIQSSERDSQVPKADQCRGRTVYLCG